MNSINLGIKGDSSSVYELISILDIKGCDGNIIYEIHDQTTSGGGEPHSEFKNRSLQFYDAFINSGMVDQWACNDISYAAKVDNVWYFLHDTGSNTYLGGGPTSTLRLREFCYKKGIKILYIEDIFTNWTSTLFRESPNKFEGVQKKSYDEAEIESNDNVLSNPEPTLSESYSDVNQIISKCGEGIQIINSTAQNLNENDYRNLFFAAVNSHHPNIFPVAENLSRNNGRSDLELHDKRRSELPKYIYEFKVYGSKKNIIDGLDKIINKYPTPKDKLTGLVIINKKIVGLDVLLKRIEKYIDDIDIVEPHIFPDLNNNRIVVTHKHHLNKKESCKLTIHLFDIQNKKVQPIKK